MDPTPNPSRVQARTQSESGLERRRSTHLANVVCPDPGWPITATTGGRSDDASSPAPAPVAARGAAVEGDDTAAGSRRGYVDADGRTKALQSRQATASSSPRRTDIARPMGLTTLWRDVNSGLGGDSVW